MTGWQRYLSILCVSLFCFSYASLSWSAPRPSLGIVPFQVNYPSKTLDWAGYFLQEELTHQLILSRKFALRSAEAMQLWSQKLNLTTDQIAPPEMLQIGVQKLIRVELQKVIGHVSLEGALLSFDQNQQLQKTAFHRILPWKSPDEVIFALVDEISKILPSASEISPFPQHYQWESLEAFYLWKLQSNKTSGTAEWQDYKEELETLLSHYPDIARLIHRERAALLLLEGTQPIVNETLLKQAESAIRETLLLDPKNDQNHTLLAQIYYYQNNKHAAKSESVIAHAHNPQNAMAKILYGFTIGQTIREGEKYILEGFKNNPFLKKFPTFADRNLTSYKTLHPILASWTPPKVPTGTSQYEQAITKGRNYFKQKQWEDAQKSFEFALSKEPTKLEPVLYLVRISIIQKKYDQALKTLSDLKSQFPENFQVFLYTGLIHERLKSFEQAERHYRKSLFLKSNHSQALLRLGTVLIKARRYDEAQNYLETLVRKHPNFSTGWWNLGLLYWQQKNWQKAHETLKEALRLDPNNPKIQRLITKIEKKLKP